MKKKLQDSVLVARTEEETLCIAREFASNLQKGDIVALEGDLGAGKTTFVKGAISFLTFLESDLISSPTFTYLHLYEGRFPIFHFDLYRIEKEKAFVQMGLLEILNQKEGICFIEWPSRIFSLLPSQTKWVHLKYHGKGRKIIFK